MTETSLSDVYFAKVDKDGKLLWSQTYGGEGDDAAYSIVQSSDGGFVSAGYTYYNGLNDYDVYLVKTDINGELGLARVDSTANTITLYRGANDLDWNYVRIQIWRID